MSEDLTTRILDGHEGNLDTAAFSPDSSLLVTTSDNSTARIWDAKTGAAALCLRMSHRRRSPPMEPKSSPCPGTRPPLSGTFQAGEDCSAWETTGDRLRSLSFP